MECMVQEKCLVKEPVCTTQRQVGQIHYILLEDVICVSPTNPPVRFGRRVPTTSTLGFGTPASPEEIDQQCAAEKAQLDYFYPICK